MSGWALVALFATTMEAVFAFLWLRTLRELHRTEAERDDFWDELNGQDVTP